MEKLIERQEAFDGFMERREKVNKSVDIFEGEDSFLYVFSHLKVDAARGDGIAADVLAYFYRNGIEGYITENYMNYICWELLAGAWGNSFAIEKLQFLFGYAYDAIIDHVDFPLIKKINQINETNYIPKIGQHLCVQMVEKMKLDPEALALVRDEDDRYKPEYFRDIRKTIDSCLDGVVEAMKKA